MYIIDSWWKHYYCISRNEFFRIILLASRLQRLKLVELFFKTKQI